MYLKENIFPANSVKVFYSASISCRLQQDNARFHVSTNDALVTKESQKDDWNVSLPSQLPNFADYMLSIEVFSMQDKVQTLT